MTNLDFQLEVQKAQKIVDLLTSTVENLAESTQKTQLNTATITLQSGIDAALVAFRNHQTAAATSIFDTTTYLNQIDTAINEVISVVDAVNQVLHSEDLAAIISTVETLEVVAAQFVSVVNSLSIANITGDITAISNCVVNVGDPDTICNAIRLIYGLFFQGNTIFDLDHLQQEFLSYIQDLIHTIFTITVQTQCVLNTTTLLAEIVAGTNSPPTIPDITHTIDPTVGELIYDFIAMLFDSSSISSLVSSMINRWFMEHVLAPDQTQGDIAALSSIESAVSELTTFPGVASEITPFVPQRTINENSDGFVYIPVDNEGKAQIILPETYSAYGSELIVKFLSSNRVVKSEGTYIGLVNNRKPSYRFEKSGLEYVEFAPMKIRIQTMLNALLDEYDIEHPDQKYEAV